MLSALKMTCTCRRTPGTAKRRGVTGARPRRIGLLALLLALGPGVTPVQAAPASEGRITLGESVRGPDITIIEREEQTVFEYRQNGQLRMVRVVPKWGKPYYLVPRDPTSGFGDLERADMLLPSWVIAEF